MLSLKAFSIFREIQSKGFHIFLAFIFGVVTHSDLRCAYWLELFIILKFQPFSMVFTMVFCLCVCMRVFVCLSLFFLVFVFGECLVTFPLQIIGIIIFVNFITCFSLKLVYLQLYLFVGNHGS